MVTPTTVQSYNVQQQIEYTDCRIVHLLALTKLKDLLITSGRRGNTLHTISYLKYIKIVLQYMNHRDIKTHTHTLTNSAHAALPCSIMHKLSYCGQRNLTCLVLCHLHAYMHAINVGSKNADMTCI